MARSTAAKQVRLATQGFELMVAAPQVVAHRMSRMMLGARGKADRRDLRRMGAEKAEAAAEVFNDMAVQAMRSGQQALSSYAQAWMQAFTRWWFPFPGTSRARFPAWGLTRGEAERFALDMFGAAMAPVHRRATANARRLGAAARR